MILNIKEEFVQRILNSEHFRKELIGPPYEPDYVAGYFITKRQSQGLRLTHTGFSQASLNAKLPKYAFPYPEKIQNLSFLLDVSKYMPVPFYIDNEKEPTIYVFDEKTSVAITMVDGIKNFISARKFQAA